MSLENASPTDIPHLEQNLMSLPEFTLEKAVKLQKNCSKPEQLHFAQIPWASYIRKLSISIVHFQQWSYPKSLLNTYFMLYTILGHTGAMKLYYFIKSLYCFQGMRKKIHQYIRSCHKCQIMILQKPHFINLHQDIAQMPQDHISIDLLGPYNVTSQGNSYTLSTDL